MSDASVSATATRTYRSELRAEQARQTRRRILEAAAAEFSRNGYQATTIAAIARAARVSTETVKSAGTKADLLIRAFEITFAGVEGRSTLTDTERVLDMLALPDAEFIAATVDFVAMSNAASSRLWTVLLAASFSDDVVAEALATMLDNRHRDFLALAEELRRRRFGKPDLDVERAGAELSFLLSPEGHQQLVAQSGWSNEQYRAWLTAALLRVARDDADAHELRRSPE